MDTNTFLADIILRNWGLLLLVIALNFPIIKPNYLNVDDIYYLMEYDETGRFKGYKIQQRTKLTLLYTIIILSGSCLEALLRLASNIIVSLILNFGTKEIASILIFIVVGFDIFYQHQISQGAIILIGMGIIALYLQQLIAEGSKLTFFGLVKWERQTQTIPLYTVSQSENSLSTAGNLNTNITPIENLSAKKSKESIN